MADDLVAKVQKAYSFSGPVLELGALVIDSEAHPDAPVRLPLSMMNRHGLVAGATGTGKTKTLQVMAEQLSAAGVPVFLADVKGDLSGIAAPGQAGDRTTARAKDVGDTTWTPTASRAQFFALGGLGTGAPIRTRVTSFGPVLLAKVLGLNDTQASSLNLVFHYADQAGLELDDIADLRAVMTYLTSDEGKAELAQLGGLSASTVGVILRELVAFEDQGADAFFGEPEFDTADLLTVDNGVGVVSVLELAAVQDKPALFSSFLMWLLADLFHDLPEVGDLDKPKLVFFFDEAHLLFADASKDFLESIAQTVRLIRSKGVGVFFVTQNPTDVSDEVLGQLGNRVQHALRAFTPDDAKALKRTVSTFPKSSYDLEELLTTLGIGEAVVTVLSETGAPTPVAWTRLRPPQSLMAAMDPTALQQAVAASPLQAKYATRTNDASAAEKLAARDQALQQAAAAPPAAPEPQAESRAQREAPMSEAGGAAAVAAGIFASPVFKSFARSAASAAGREITRSLFGTSRRRRR